MPTKTAAEPATPLAEAPDLDRRPENRSATASTTDVVRLDLPAASAYVTVLRSTAAALAARIDFTIDEIEDLRIAVDEACALLLAQSVPGSEFSCVFHLSGHELVVSVTARSEKPRMPSRDSFAWTVLTALVADVRATVDTDAGSSTLTLTKQAIAVRATAANGDGTQPHESERDSTDKMSQSSETAE